MRASDKNLTVLSEAEREALYGLPDFDSFQRADYFSLTNEERLIAQRRNGISEQILCMLQIGYFKAKQTFYNLSFSDAPQEDVDFLLRCYYPGILFSPKPARQAEYYVQRNEIVKLFGYRLWTKEFTPLVTEKAVQLALSDVTPIFIVTELIAFLNQQKIVRPGYTTLQAIIVDVLSVERKRLGGLIEEFLDEAGIRALKQLLVRDDTLSELAAIKQDAKNFSYQMMVAERQKRATLEPLYSIAKTLLPKLGISQQNKNHYASLANFYSIYDLRRLKPGQTYLYLLCYAWQRYQQLNDNLVSAFFYQLKKLEEETKTTSKQQFTQSMASKQQEAPQVGHLILLYVDEAISDATLFGAVRNQAFNIMPKDSLITAGQRLCQQLPSQMALRWEAIDKITARCKKNLRPLAMAINFSSIDTQNPWLMALNWMKTVFYRQQTLAQRSVSEIPIDTIPKRLRPHLLVLDEEGNATRLRGDRYEFWIYRQIRKRFDINELYLNDSMVNRRFSDDLVSRELQADLLEKLDIAWLRQPLHESIDALYLELGQQWQLFDRELRQGKLKHLAYDSKREHLTWHKPKANKDEALQTGFYAKLQAHGIADIFRFVNEQCHFLSAFTPLQPRYAKKIADEDSLMATIIAQALNHGNLSMAETSDIPYHILEATYQQYLRLSTLKASNDRISHFISELSIFPYYSFGLEHLYGSVDGQKLEMGTPTLKARHSRKYFGRGKGVVAYTLLCNHVPVNGDLIGAHEHESHFLFDICYHNTSNIIPTVITGDMHSINKANFAILHWFGMKLMPRFVSLQAQLKHLYCADNIANYEKFLIRPAGQINRLLIESDQAHMDQIVATLGLKEMTQSTLIRKLCALPHQNRTRKAIFEFDKLVRSIYTLKYLRDPHIERDVHRSQNRIESYHQLRSYTSQVSGKKQLIGRTEGAFKQTTPKSHRIYINAIAGVALNRFRASQF